MSGNVLAIVEVLEATVPSKDIHLIAIRLYRPHNLYILHILHASSRYNEGSRRKVT